MEKANGSLEAYFKEIPDLCTQTLLFKVQVLLWNSLYKNSTE